MKRVMCEAYTAFDSGQGSRDLGISDVCRSCVVDWLLDMANDVAWRSTWEHVKRRSCVPTTTCKCL